MTEKQKRDPEGTKAAILEAAMEEFAEYGLGGGRVDRVAARAGANKRMLYHYFGNKSDLFLAVIEESYARIRNAEKALDLESRDPEDAIKTFIDFSWNYQLNTPGFISLLNTENLYKAEHLKRSEKIPRMNSAFIEMFGGILKRGGEEGVFRKDVDPIQLYITISSIGYFYLNNRYTLGLAFSKDMVTPEALEERRQHNIDMIMRFLKP